MRRLRLLGATAVLAALFVAAGATSAAAASFTATGHSIRAVFTYRGTFPMTHDAHLLITVAGATRYDGPVASKWCGRICWPNQIAPGQHVLSVARLERGGPYDVVLSLYTGGAHCCTVEQVFSPSRTGAPYAMKEFDFGDPPANLRDLGVGGSGVFVSANDAFAYAFTDYAASGMPLEVVSFSGGAFHNVTRRYPTLIRRDAAMWLRAFNAQSATHYSDTVGLAAAWAADEEMLGQHGAVRSFLSREAAAGHLNSGLSGILPSGERFVSALYVFLRRHGYST